MISLDTLIPGILVFYLIVGIVACMETKSFITRCDRGFLVPTLLDYDD
jgi:hypothetical protein